MTVPVPDQLEFISVADGVTRDFPYPKRFMQADEIKVLLRGVHGADTPQYLGQHFSISGSSWPNGGAVSFYTAPPSGLSVVRYRATQAKQTVDLENKQRNDAKAVEVQLDRLTMGLQDQVRVAERSLKFAVGTNVSDMKSLPLPERGKALVGNAAGDGYINAPIAEGDIAVAVEEAEAARDIAVDAKDIAVEKADISISEAAQSKQERIAAELAAQIAITAKDAAFVNAAVYPDIAAGLVATVSGGQFQVVSGDEIIRFRNNSGAAVEVARYPSAAKVAPLLTISPAGYKFAITDEGGLASFAIKDDGTAVIARIENKQIEYADTLEGVAPLGYAFSVLDPNGIAAIGIKDDGAFVANKLEALTLNGVPVSAIIEGGGGSGVVGKPRYYPAEYNLVQSYGQSLSVGTDSVPPITVTQRFDNLKPEGGVRPRDSVTPYTSLVPLTETQASTLGETPIGGATDIIKELIKTEDGLKFVDHTFRMVGTATGAGGAVISQLIKGTAAYAYFMTAVQSTYDLAQAAGKTFGFNGFFWTQAESDYSINTPAETYKAALVGLRNDVDADTKAITKQTDPVVCISYQVNGHATYGHAGNPYLAVAQLEVARENPHHYVACPLYWSPQTVHQSAQNSKILGAYYGLCYKRVVIDGEDWRPVEPLSVRRQGNVINLQFNVPHGRLVMDTAAIALRANYGFSVVTPSGVAYTISSVEITGPSSVKIITTTPAVGGRVRYGYTNGGNLRDEQGNVIIFDGGGLNKPLHNWCVIFNESLN